jgi:hypothetical protein
MATTKRILGNYTITNKETAGANVVISTGTLFIDGNLQIGGNSQSISHTNTDITDNIVVLNKGETNAGVSSPGFSGIQIDRGSLGSNVALRWNENVTNWQISSDGSTFANVATSGSLSVSNLDMSTYSIYSSTMHTVKFDDNVAIKNTTVAPTAVAGYNVVYAQTPSGGGSGLYITNSTYTAQELVTKSKAVAYSIVFG